MSLLITGGTGKTASRLAQALDQRGAAYWLASRHPPAAGQGRYFDWADPGTWDAALEGVRAAYLVPPPVQAAEVMVPFVRRAQDRGCRRFVLLSASLLPAGGPGAGQVHQWLAEHAAEWAVLRPSWFMENFSQGPHRQTILAEDRIYSATQDGRVPFIAAQDIAAVAAELLTAPAAPNTDLVLTGPQAISYDQAAAILSGVLGRPIQHARISIEALIQRHLRQGVAEDLAQVLAAMDGMIAHGAEDRTTDHVAAISRQAPTGFEAFCQAHAAAWAR